MDPRFLRRGPFKDRASIRVAVLDADEPPRFSRARYHMDVSENCPPACTVGRVSAVDPDTGLTNNIRYGAPALRQVNLASGRFIAVFNNGGRLFSDFGGNGQKENRVPISSGDAESGCAGVDWRLVYSRRYLDNQWHFKRASICHDNLCILNLWPFECRLPYRCLTHSPRPLLSFRLPPPSPPAPSSTLLFASFSLPLPSPCFQVLH